MVLSVTPGPVLTPPELESPPLLDLPHAATPSAAGSNAPIARALTTRRLMWRSPSTRWTGGRRSRAPPPGLVLVGAARASGARGAGCPPGRPAGTAGRR